MTRHWHIQADTDHRLSLEAAMGKRLQVVLTIIRNEGKKPTPELVKEYIAKLDKG